MERNIEQEKETITITFGERVENHVGMQQIGEIAEIGFSLDDLLNVKNKIEEGKGEEIKVELVELKYTEKYSEEENVAYVLIIRNALKYMEVDVEELFSELKAHNWDSKAYMYGRVVNKKARYNVCYDEKDQEPNFEEKKGTIISWNTVPQLFKVKNKLEEVFGEVGKNLKAEGNRYYDTKKCGIGYHGDSERKKVIGLRLGNSMPLCYQWYFKGKPVGERYTLNINSGDIYIMSEKATGYDWKKKNIPTLRHAAGAEKYINPASKSKKDKDKNKDEEKGEKGEDINLEDKTVIELKEICRDKGIKGYSKLRKAELIEYIKENM